MAWIHIPSIPSTFSPDTAGFNLGFDSPASPSGPFATSSGTSTASKLSASVKSMACSIPLPSGTTSKVLTDDPGVERWIFSVLASRASPTQTRGCGRSPEGFPMIETSGPIASESYLKWDQNAQFWRTSQASMWEMENGQHMGAPWLDSFPKSGICQNGELYPLPMLERPTSDPGGGSWPTPTSRDHKDGDAHSCQNVPVKGLLGRAVHSWPTPAAFADSFYVDNSPNATKRHSMGLATTVAKMLPTLTSRDHKDSGPNVNWEPVAKKSKLAGVVQMLPAPSSAYPDDEALLARLGGALSPDWVSWLMGLPIGWTSLEPLAQEDYDEWFEAQRDGTWWQEERGLPRIATGIKDRVNRLKCLGNGIVPASLALFLR
jgi:hypothetical protein